MSRRTTLRTRKQQRNHYQQQFFSVQDFLQSSAENETNQVVPFKGQSRRRNHAAPQPAAIEYEKYVPGDFTIAIVCALPHEFDPVRALFDNEESVVYRGPEDDQNIYIVGKFAGHYTVLIMQAEEGEVDAGMCTQRLRDHFKNIQLTFLVGTCGAMPVRPQGDEEPIYLGDVIVGTQVWRYLHNGRIIQSPSRFGSVVPELRNMIAESTSNRVKVLGNLLMTESFLEQVIDDGFEYVKYLQMRKGGHKYNYPGYGKDKLFQPNRLHRHYQDCISSDGWHCSCIQENGDICPDALASSCEDLQCKVSRERNRLQDKEEIPPVPNVHVGTIASADVVMRASPIFDARFKQNNVLGIDTEGGGVSRATDCIVIKGAVDYADTHANQIFAKYAAATAASVTKAFIRNLFPPSRS